MEVARSLARPKLAFVRLALAASMALVLLSACGNDPKAANIQNFTRAIDASLETDAPSAISDGSSLCLENTPTLPGEVSDLDYMGAENNKYYRPYVQADLVTESTAYRTQPGASGTRRYAIHRYTLSNTGKANATQVKWFRTSNKFCYASFRVGKVVNFTEPADMFGQHISEVRWTPTVVAVADWAKSDRVSRALPEIGQSIAALTAREKTSTVVLTSTGWEVTR